MKYGEVNLGQVEAVINILGGEEGLGKLLSGELKVIPRELVVLLVPDGSYSSEVIPLGDPYVFYQNCKGLYFRDGFEYDIVPAAKTIRKEMKIDETPRFRVAISTSGEQLLSEHPNAVWTATDFCSWLEAKLKKMSSGNGELRADANWTGDYFLVRGVNDVVHVVHVRWRSDGSKACDLICRDLKYRLDPGDTFAPRN